MNKINLLIHHHATIYVDPKTQEMFTFSYIARWVNAIAPLVDSLGLLFYTTKVKSIKHDTLLSGKNIILESLFEKEQFYQLKKRRRKFIQVYEKISDKYSCLLIRGITPDQYLIGNVFVYKKNYFLLVGSFVDSRPNFEYSFYGVLFFVLYFWRLKEISFLSKRFVLFANSFRAKDELMNEFGKFSTFVPTNTLSLTEILPFREKEINFENLTLLFCGRIMADKGIFELLEAFYLLTLENKKHKLIIVGELSEIINNKIKGLKYYSDIEKNIEFKGFVKFGSELLEIYDKSDFYILPSYHEGFPHSIWEAAATCTPVLTTKVGGIPSVVNENEVTFLEKKSSFDIFDKIMFLKSNQSFVTKKSKALHSKLKEYTVENCAKILVDEIRK